MKVIERRMDRLETGLREAGIRYATHEPLGRYTTIGIGGPAEVLVFPASTEELLEAFRITRELGAPPRVLGGGSNLLVADEGVPGVVIHTGAMKIVRFGETGRVEAEAGVHFPGLVRSAVARGLRGLEGGVGIPGSLGGVLAMNAGAYGFSIGEKVESVTVLRPEGEKLELPRQRIDFRYRSSSLGEGLIVARCALVLDEDDVQAIRSDMEAELADRKTTQPVGVRSAGCIFKNPDGDSAGRLIDDAGLKGHRVGGAWISQVHANFIVHDGKARAADVVALIDDIKERVFRATSVELEEEVKRWP